jgi:hypothetical protein
MLNATKADIPWEIFPSGSLGINKTHHPGLNTPSVSPLFWRQLKISTPYQRGTLKFIIPSSLLDI